MFFFSIYFCCRRKGGKLRMRRIQKNLRPQGDVKYRTPRLHVDFPIILYSDWSHRHAQENLFFRHAQWKKVNLLMCLQIKTRSTDMRSRDSLQAQLRIETKSTDMRSRVSRKVQLQTEPKVWTCAVESVSKRNYGRKPKVRTCAVEPAS